MTTTLQEPGELVDGSGVESSAWWLSLYRRYDGELRRLGSELRPIIHRMFAEGSLAAFGDIEGELLYMLIRETKPKQVFEISPAAGWSTNYLLAALTANGEGVLHSFELKTTINGRQTEALIRSHQAPRSNQRQLMVHIGDARLRVHEVPGTIDLLFIDSCHEAWFAEWYVPALFPRVKGPVMIQDIAFVDELEPCSSRPAGEAKFVWDWLQQHPVGLILLGRIQLEADRQGLRRGYPERRNLRSNSICFRLPAEPSEAPATPSGAPLSLIEQARQAAQSRDLDRADRLLNEAVALLLQSAARVNRHRLFVQAGLVYRQLGQDEEARRCFQRAFGMAIQTDRPERIRALPELLEQFAWHRQWRLMALTVTVMTFEPKSWTFAAIRFTHVCRGWWSHHRPTRAR